MKITKVTPLSAGHSAQLQ